MSCTFFYSDRYLEYYASPEHPLSPNKYLLTLELLKHYELDIDYMQPEPATFDQLLLAHSRDYVKVVKHPDSLDSSMVSRFGLGSGDNPVFEDMFDVTRHLVGGSIQGGRLVMDGEVQHAMNPAAGLHHGHSSRASGFCVFNDVAVAIAYLRKKYGSKMMYIDIDVHHADGVQRMFYSDDDVLVVSLHEIGKYLFPKDGFVKQIGEGDGIGYNVNVPLLPYTFDEPFQFAFEEVIPPLAYEFNPDIIIYQCGADGHFTDPLGHLYLTTGAYSIVTKIVHKLSHEVSEGRLLLLGGGGYEVETVPRVWTLIVSEIVEKVLDERLPESWLQFYQHLTERPPPKYLEDETAPEIDKTSMEKIWENTREVVDRVKDEIFKLHGL